jgi:hypothetical protein
MELLENQHRKTSAALPGSHWETSYHACAMSATYAAQLSNKMLRWRGGVVAWRGWWRGVEPASPLQLTAQMLATADGRCPVIKSAC